MTFFNVRTFGAAGDGRTVDTAAFNAALRAANEAGGGTVIVPPGTYLSYSVRLHSRTTLHLEAGAIIIAADPPAEGEPGGYDAPEAGPVNYHQDFGHSRFCNSLFWGDGLNDVAITGRGRIYGRGLSRGNGRIALPVGVVAPQPPGRLPDVLEADGDFTPFAGPLPPPGEFGYPHARDTLPAGVANKAIALVRCRNVLLDGFEILHGGHFAVLVTASDQVTVQGLVIDTNRDGIDIDGCSNVRITRCSVNSPWDDGICLKASYGSGELRVCENITISDCFVSGFQEGSLLDGRRVRSYEHRGGPIGRIKLGTESSGGYRNVTITNCVFDHCRGLALEQVDGGVMENIVVSNISLREVMNSPLFIRLGERCRTPRAGNRGSARAIAISNMVASDVAPEHGIFIAGCPGLPITDVSLSNIRLYSRGGGQPSWLSRDVPEMADGYPEPFLFGALPAWGLYVRHVQNLALGNATFTRASDDARPCAHLEDVGRCALSDVQVQPAACVPQWHLITVGNAQFRACEGRDDGIFDV